MPTTEISPDAGSPVHKESEASQRRLARAAQGPRAEPGLTAGGVARELPVGERPAGPDRIGSVMLAGWA
jgi:hypothetical protein